MKKYKVLILTEAEKDLVGIGSYVSRNDSPLRARQIVDELEEACKRLASFPHRGRIVPELRRVNITTFSELIHKPYRIIYQVANNLVFIHAVLDSRRDLDELLYKRLVQN